MNAEDLNGRLVAIGEKIKAKGWKSVFIDIGISYLAMFDRAPGPQDPMISYCPGIRATIHHSKRYGDWEDGQNAYRAGRSFDIRDIDTAVAVLEELADKMPRMADESARIKAAKAKLSDEERHLLGIR